MPLLSRVSVYLCLCVSVSLWLLGFEEDSLVVVLGLETFWPPLELFEIAFPVLAENNAFLLEHRLLHIQRHR